MSVKTFKEVASILPIEQSVLLRAVHGVGKSMIVRQVAFVLKEKMGLNEYKVIDRRLSQMSEGDMIGLPSTDGNVTRFNPPDWYMEACNIPCCLFLDELNRATPEVMQAAFQVVLDRELNGWKLHPKTRVFSAINLGSQYTVNEMDPALLSRFWAIDLKPTVEDWLNWAKDTTPVGGNIHPNLIDFIKTNEKWLNTPKNSEPGKKVPDPRSWEHLNTALVQANLMEEPDNPLFWSMCLGFIGIEATNAFVDYVKSMDRQFTGKDILEKYSKVKNKIMNAGQERYNIAIDRLVDYVVKHCETVTKKQGENIAEFMRDVPGELRILLWTKLTANGTAKIKLTRSVHAHVMPLVLDVFGVAPGEAGVGMVPNMPCFTTAKEKAK
jgi:hypothetical protein